MQKKKPKKSITYTQKQVDALMKEAYLQGLIGAIGDPAMYANNRATKMLKKPMHEVNKFIEKVTKNMNTTSTFGEVATVIKISELLNIKK